MPNTSVVCDASFVLKLALKEEESQQAAEIWSAWAAGAVERCAPAVLWYEIASALTNKVARRILTAAEALNAFDALAPLAISILAVPAFHREAMNLAIQLHLRAAYDAHYLVLARSLDAEFWTADERLFNSVKDGFPLIHLLAPA